MILSLSKTDTLQSKMHLALQPITGRYILLWFMSLLCGGGYPELHSVMMYECALGMYTNACTWECVCSMRNDVFISRRAPLTGN